MGRVVVLLLTLCLVSFGWDGHTVSRGGYKVSIDELSPVVEPSKPTGVTVRLKNGTVGKAVARVKVHKLVDDWRVVGASEKALELDAGQDGSLSFEIQSGPFVFNALYPVHVAAAFQGNGEGVTLEAVRIFSVSTASGREDLAERPELPVLRLDDGGVLSLIGQADKSSVSWQYYDGPMMYRQIGFLGGMRSNYGSFYTSFDDGREAVLRTHPPWRGDGGIVYGTYRVSLPAGSRTRLEFAVKQRQEAAGELKSDGITYKVSVAEAGDGTYKDVFNRHLNVRDWADFSVDLSAYGGKTIDLRLETNPGPARNTACDGAYWGKLLLKSGKGEQAVADYGQGLGDEMLRRLAASEDGHVLMDGAYGILDGWIGYRQSGSHSVFHGFEMHLDDSPVLRASSVYAYQGHDVVETADGKRYAYRFKGAGKNVDVTVTVTYPVAGVCRVHFEAKGAYITHVKLAPWHDVTQRLIFGHGYVLKNPGRRDLVFNGHVVAASHAGYEFANGPAVVQGIDLPPTHLTIAPGNRIASLCSKGNCAFTLVYGKTAYDAVFKYAGLETRKAADGFKNVSGRMLFDIWHGTRGASVLLDNLREAIRYGLTDTMLTIHDWQRWGYDYRLPDIWPPRPSWGTVEQAKAIGDLCGAHRIPWGFHDNYIDFYPDAEGFTYKNVYFLRNFGDYHYEHVTFPSSNAQPSHAWNNRGRKAQSYKFRPDTILPFIKRNYERILQDVRPTASFLDVFCAVKPADWYDWQGNYHTMEETRRYWGEAFATIRSMLGNNAPTTSEAGHDQLIGWLDGADCQWLTISDERDEFHTNVPCEDWARTPWFDAVHHPRFALIGAGYSNRYQGNRQRPAHGIISDDYLCSELMAAHNLMGDAQSWGYDNVRKYWLAQDFIRSTAGKKMVGHEFVDGNIKHQRIQWDTGATVLVNRSQQDWTVDGKTLPAYGFAISYPGGELSLEKRDGVYREYSRSGEHEFFNARNRGNRRRLIREDVLPRMERVEHLGNGLIRYRLSWEASTKPSQDYRVFLHFMTQSGRRVIAFQDDHKPSKPSTEWSGRFVYERDYQIPVESVKHKSYTVVCGLFSAVDGARVALRGKHYHASAVELGKLHVRLDGQGGISDVTFEACKADAFSPSEYSLNPAGTLVDFGKVKTDGMFRLSRTSSGVLLTPAPGQKPFKATLDLTQCLPGYAGGDVEVVGEPLRQGERVDFKAVRRGSTLELELEPEGLFRLELREK